MDSFRYCACELKLRLGSGLGACEFYVIVWFERFGMQGRGGEGTKIWLGMRGEMVTERLLVTIGGGGGGGGGGVNAHGEASRDHLGGGGGKWSRRGFRDHLGGGGGGNGHGEASRDHLGGVKLQTTADIFSNNATRSTVVFCSGDNCLWNLKPQSLYSSSYSSS